MEAFLILIDSILFFIIILMFNDMYKITRRMKKDPELRAYIGKRIRDNKGYYNHKY